MKIITLDSAPKVNYRHLLSSEFTPNREEKRDPPNVIHLSFPSTISGILCRRYKTMTDPSTDCPNDPYSPSEKIMSASQETATPPPPNLDSPSLYINRELSLLAFNRRVLELAQDGDTPLLERLRYLCISSTNLDEFFEVRVSGLKEHVHLGIDTRGPDNLTAAEQLSAIAEEAHALVNEQYQTLNQDLLPKLEEQGIVFLHRDRWTEEARQWLHRFFRRELLPLLSPLGLDPSHPFPRIQNKSLNFIVTLKGKDAFGRESGMAIVQAPRALPRFIELPESIAGASHRYVFLSSILHAYVDELFPGMIVKGCYQFRVTRNTDLFVDDEAVDDLKEALSGELPSRNYGEAVRLEVADNCSTSAKEYLRREFKLEEDDTFQVHGPVNLNRLANLYREIDRPSMKYPDFTPRLPAPLLQKDKDLFAILRQQDVLLHHPYQSFAPVHAILRQAATDPQVLAIKQTLYRTGDKSDIVKNLIKAAQNGKEVTVIIELKARFDEQANIRLANRLQDAGCHVVYGVLSYKTHAKLMLIVRREGKRIARYVHMGTGNYHSGTARAYTDIGLMTADKIIGEDVHRIFQQLTGLGRIPKPRKLIQAPFNLHKSMLEKIQREIDHALEGKPAKIMLRMNSLVEEQSIRALYEASMAGVKIDIVVRGICCLRPGIPSISDNIRVRSVMGRFLEHPRVFYFENGGEKEVLSASADWMPRNFFRRIETCFPVEDPVLKKRVTDETLSTYMSDNTHSWELRKDGSYRRRTPGSATPREAQCTLMLKLGTLHSQTEPLSQRKKT